MPSLDNTFDALMKRISEGSDDAVWELMDRYHSSIMYVIRRRIPHGLRRKVDSTDIAQSVWKSLLRMEDTLCDVSSANQFVALISEMARRKTNETARNLMREKRDLRIEVPLDPVAEEANDANRATVDRQALPPGALIELQERWDREVARAGKHARAIVAFRLQGLENDEIAADLGVSVRNVQYILNRLVRSFVR